MKKLIATVIAILTLASAAFASFVEIDRKGEDTSVQSCIEKPVSPSISLFTYACLSEKWQEAYVGPELNGKAGDVAYQVAYGIGQETGGNRNGGWLWAGYKKLSAIYLSENGATGPWAKGVIQYKVSPKLGLGYVKKSFAGEGVYLQYKLTNSATLKVSGFDKFKNSEIGLNFLF